MLKFDVNRDEAQLIDRIAERAVRLRVPGGYRKMDALMDVTACHASGQRLRLADLLAADDFNFAHDVLGIRRHLDRETGALGGRFLPRFSEH